MQPTDRNVTSPEGGSLSPLVSTLDPQEQGVADLRPAALPGSAPSPATRSRPSAAAANAAVLLHYPKYLTNLGMIARIGGCYDIGGLWYSGHRISLEVRRLPRELRMRQYIRPAPISLYDEAIKGRTPVAVEVLDNAESLPQFEHPENALYIFGPEDGSLPPEVLKRCHRFVRIPVQHCLSLPVAVATILYDRAAKACDSGSRSQSEDAGTAAEAEGRQSGDASAAHRPNTPSVPRDNQ